MERGYQDRRRRPGEGQEMTEPSVQGPTVTGDLPQVPTGPRAQAGDTVPTMQVGGSLPQPIPGGKDALGKGYAKLGTGAQGLRKLTEEDIARANTTLMKYRSGKSSIDQRVISSEQWWRMRHWQEMETQGNAWDIQPKSGWLFNVVISKHADGIQAIPEANVLPREAGDRATAKQLSDVLPCILDQNAFREVYSDVLWQKLKQGTGVYGVFWDGSKLGGLGDVDIRRCDLLSLYWEPGVRDIQDSRNVFYVQLVDNETLEERYPQLKGKLGDKSVQPLRMLTEEHVDTIDKTAVVDWYYKRADGENTVLHYCKYCAGEILYSSENEGMHAWYEHGRYPFVLDPLFPIEGSPCGFGYIDVGKSEQEYIDLLKQSLIENALWNTRPRYMVRQDGAVNEQEAADWRKTFVHVDAGLGEESIREMPMTSARGDAINLLTATIDELKQVTGNTDSSQGINQSSSMAASAIAALQEASGKTSRAATLSAYRAFERVVWMVIELIRQFYDVQRTYRITGEQGEEEFVQFDNSGLQPQPQGEAFGVDMGYRLPVFDLKVQTQTATQYTKNMANEWAVNLWQLGVFEPANADKALMMLEMMDFEQKEDVVRMIRKNATLMQMLLQYQQLALSLAAKYEPAMAEGLAAQITGQPAAGGTVEPQGGTEGRQETPNEETQQQSTAKVATQVQHARERASVTAMPNT